MLVAVIGATTALSVLAVAALPYRWGQVWLIASMAAPAVVLTALAVASPFHHGWRCIAIAGVFYWFALLAA